MISMFEHKLFLENSNFEIFSKSKFDRKPKIGTALDSVFCQLYDYKIKSDFLIKFRHNFFFFYNNFFKIATYLLRKTLKKQTLTLNFVTLYM